MFFTLLVATIVVEAILYWIVLRKDVPRLLLFSILINCVTLPPATWMYRHVIPDLVIVEAGVVLAETVLILLLMQLPPARAFLLSLLANGVTAVIGILIPFP
ncbi:MAG: hypothetical protein LUQ64_02855 [Methanomicrobiales archaeon]|nr:hypothetical protein [Methanomicrobiales archaeon]